MKEEGCGCLKDLLGIEIESLQLQVFKVITLISLHVVTSGTEKPQRPVVLTVGIHVP